MLTEAINHTQVWIQCVEDGLPLFKNIDRHESRSELRWRESKGGIVYRVEFKQDS